MAAGDGAPPLLTERDEPLVRDCAWAAMVMLAWWAGQPVTVGRPEREALARAGGFPEGEEATDWTGLQHGTTVRYGWAAHYLEGTWAEVLALPADAYLVLFGRYGALPVHFRRWDTFTGLHALGYRPSDGWWQDPEATRPAIAAGFQGETIPGPAARAYAEGWPDGHVHALWMQREELTVNRLPIGNLTPGVTVDLAKGAQLYSAPDVAYRTMAAASTGIPTLFYTGTGYVAIKWAGELVLVKSAVVKVNPAPAPPPLDCTAAVTAAVAPLQAKIDAARRDLS